MKDIILNTLYAKRYTLCVILIALLCIILPPTAQAAEYYLDVVNGDDANPGTSELPWKTLNRAYTWYSGSGAKVQEGDTVLFRDGNYGQFKESTADNPGEKWLFYRNDWITYKADTGHAPAFSSVYIRNQDRWEPIEHGRSYIIIDGFTVNDGVSIVYGTQYVKILNCSVTRQPTAVKGYYAPYFVPGAMAINGRDAHHITIQGNDVSNTYRGIFVWGSDWLVKNNTIHHTADDSIVILGSDNTIEGNLMYGIRPYGTTSDVYGTKTGTFINGEVVTMTGTNAEGIVHDYASTYLRVYPTTQQTLYDYWIENKNRTVVGAESGATIVITDTMGRVDPPHTDCLQVDLGAGSAGMTGLIIRNNIMDRYRSVGTDGIRNGQGLKLWAADSENLSCTVEGNVINASNQSLFQGLRDANFYNNTVAGAQNFRFMCGGASSTINNMYNNLIAKLLIQDAAGGYSINFKNHGNNIFGSGQTGQSADYPFTLNGTEIVVTNFAGMFVAPNADPADFTLVSGSAAIDFGTPGYGLSTDILGNPRDAYPDAGCYEYGASTILYGDVSGEGEISAYDAALTAQAAVDLITLTPEQTKAAEVSGDGEVTAYDAALIAQCAVGLIDKFPI